ncbi:MAG: hypothetical protein WBG50_13925 [Desulfomonilaceae bacterium]
MFSRSLRMVLIAVGLPILISCDPETVIKNKVPEPLQKALTFGSPQAALKAKQPELSTVEIVAPRKGRVYPAGRDIVFLGKAKLAGDAKQQKPNLVWKLLPEKAHTGVPLGKGNSIRKRLDPGNYRVQVTMTVGGRTVVKTVNFRVVRSMSGKVIAVEGTGLTETDLELTDLEGNQVIFSTKSGIGGAFSIEFPSEEPFRLIPRKKGFSFSPVSQIVKFEPDRALPPFKAIKGEISDIRLTESEKGDENVGNICPQQDAWLKLRIKFEHKPARVEPFLVQQENDKERLIPLEDLTDSADETKEYDPKAPVALKVRVPTGSTLGISPGSYHLRVRVYDASGNHFSAEASAPIKMNVAQCFSTKFAEALSLQEQGKLKEAIKAYSVMDDFQKTVEDSRQFSGDMQKAYFNRGIAHLGIAISKKAAEGPILGELNRALMDFNAVLKIHSRDIEALMLRGAVNHMARSYKAALKDFDTVLSINPKMVVARELRAQDLVKTGIKRNLTPAIDDFTELVGLDARNDALRKSRGEALKLLVRSESKKDDSKVDVSSISLRPIGKILNLTKYIRK